MAERTGKDLPKLMDTIISVALRHWAKCIGATGTLEQRKLAEDYADALNSDTWLLETATPPVVTNSGFDREEAVRRLVDDAMDGDRGTLRWFVTEHFNGEADVDLKQALSDAGLEPVREG